MFKMQNIDSCFPVCVFFEKSAFSEGRGKRSEFEFGRCDLRISDSLPKMQRLCLVDSKPGVNTGALKSKSRVCLSLDALNVPEALVQSIRILEVPAAFLAILWLK